MKMITVEQIIKPGYGRAPSTPVFAPGETNPKETVLLAAQPNDIID